METLTNLFVLIAIVTIGTISGCVENGHASDIEATVISLNRTEEELAYVNPPFVITGNMYYYDVLVGNNTITIKSEKELKINSTIKIKFQKTI